MKKIILTVFGIGFGLILAVLLLVGAWSLSQRSGDLLKHLRRDYSALQSRIDSSYTVYKIDGARLYQDITLFTSGFGETIQITVSLPQIKTADRLPVLFVLGGLEIGRASLTYINDPGQNVLIGYNYPYSPEYWYDNAGVNQIPAIRNAVLEVPSQVAAILRWTARQNWADTSRVNLLGYSFGAIFLPSAMHYGQQSTLSIQNGIMAYGGANLYRLLYANLKDVPTGLRAGTAWLASSAIYPVEPLEHLPSLHGEFLIINGTRDKKIPPVCWQALQNATPEPKTITNLDESHMHPRKTALTEKIVSMSREWLRQRNAINP